MSNRTINHFRGHTCTQGRWLNRIYSAFIFNSYTESFAMHDENFHSRIKLAGKQNERRWRRVADVKQATWVLKQREEQERAREVGKLKPSSRIQTNSSAMSNRLGPRPCQFGTAVLSRKSSGWITDLINTLGGFRLIIPGAL